MRRAALALILLAVAALAVANEGPARPSGGLYGKVVIDPARPVCMAGEPCSVPDAHELLLFSRSGRGVKIRTARDGTYRITLPPGRYTVTTPRRPTKIGRGLEPRSATVPRRRYARVNFSLDVGIR